MKSAGRGRWSVALLLSIFGVCVAQITLEACGDDDADVTCAFFFNKLNRAFRDESVLYTLRKSFFPTEGVVPTIFDVFLTISVESVPNISCTDPEFVFGERTVDNPPTMNEVCGDVSVTTTEIVQVIQSSRYTCSLKQWTWKHLWSKTIINHIIEVEDLELLQDTNFVAFAAAAFNTFDTSVFSQPENIFLDETDQMNTSLASAGNAVISFFLTIDFLPCTPDNGVLLDAWEDILPWVSVVKRQAITVRHHCGNNIIAY